ncbi:MAG TPA: helix-turn-helix transcriptional regulator [Afifellaceae bacterium]|nr:helix-turn-helix transcriptional regulator [Afifellaceae bacterium]
MDSAVGLAARHRQPHPIDLYVGNRIRLGRRMLNVSQEKLAENLGVTFQQVQKYENGTNRISASRLHLAARILDVPVSFFFPEVEPDADEGDAGETTSVIDFLASSEGLELNRAFSQIRDSRMRRQVLELIRSMAVSEA